MKTDPDLFQLFGSETELSAWEERIQQGRLPTRDQLKTILLANRDQPLPDRPMFPMILNRPSTSTSKSTLSPMG